MLSSDEKAAGSDGSDMCVVGSPCMARAASRNIHVQKTNGKVNELTFHGAITLLNPVRTHVVSAEQSTSASHIQTVLPMNVGNAHPTSTPLKPQSPCSPSLAGKPSRYPVTVETVTPSRAPQPTSPSPSV